MQWKDKVIRQRSISNNSQHKNKINILNIIENWIYNNDSLEMNLPDGKIFRIEKFKVIYGNINKQGDGEGIIYLKEYDEFQNQKYTICEGQFKNYQLNGQGKIYNGKSKIVKTQGQFINGQQKAKYNIQEITDRSIFRSLNSQFPNEFSTQSKTQLQIVGENLIDYIKLFINEFPKYNQLEIQNDIIKQFKQMNKYLSEQLKELRDSLHKQQELLQSQNFNYYPKQNSSITVEKQSWVKYDSIFYQKDLLILDEYSNQWFNSAIIDAYSVYLNKQDEERFWESKNKANYRRCLIIPSFIATNYFANKDYIKDIQQYFLEYEKINYNISWVYKDICFMINDKDIHWLFARVDLEKNTIFIYDSLQYQSNYKYIAEELVEILSYLQKQSLKLSIVILNDIPKQKNGYDCGLYTCIYAKWISEDKMLSQFSLPQLMRRKLKQIISQN